MRPEQEAMATGPQQGHQGHKATGSKGISSIRPQATVGACHSRSSLHPRRRVMLAVPSASAVQVEVIIMLWALILDRKNFWTILYRWASPFVCDLCVCMCQTCILQRLLMPRVH